RGEGPPVFSRLAPRSPGPCAPHEPRASGTPRTAWTSRRPRRRASLRREQGGNRERLYRIAAPGGGAPPGHRSADTLRQPDAYARLSRHEPRRSLAVDRAIGGARDAGAVCLLSPLAGWRPPDVGRTRHDAPRRRRLPSRRAPGHAADDCLSELTLADRFCSV